MSRIDEAVAMFGLFFVLARANADGLDAVSRALLSLAVVYVIRIALDKLWP